MTKSKLLSHRFVPLLSRLLLTLLFFRANLFIASTFAGTRPSHTNAPPIPEPYSAWNLCASIIATTLSDIGDAGRVWLRHAYVGTNPPPHLPSKSASSPNSHDNPSTLDDPNDKFRCRCLIPQLYTTDSPHLTAIVQSFNHHENIRNISTTLKSTPLVNEIIISEDGSTDGSLHDWRTTLSHDTHFIIRSNNLHELRSYNRALRIASGSIVVLLQDDDLLPPSDHWLRNAQRLFAALPELGVLGGYIGQTWQYPSGRGAEFGDQRSTHGGVRGGNTQPLPFIEPSTGLPFMYSECTWVAPLFIRHTLLRRVGGLELAIAKRGEPGVWQDCVLSYEAWVNGFTVGTYSAPFERGVGGHGSASSVVKLKQRERVYERAVAYTNRKYPRKRVHASVESLNNRTLTLRFPTKR